MIRSGLLLTGGNTLAALVSLARNVAVARLVTVEDFGLAATLGITVTLVEMLSKLALDRLLVQAPDGDDPDVQRGLQALSLARGVLAAAILVLIAAPYARAVGAPELEWAYRTLALVPLAQGLVHLDMVRVQRRMRFGPSVRVQLAAEAAGLAAVLPFYWLLGDWRTMLGAILVSRLAFAALSHLAGERRYRIGPGPPGLLRRAVAFGLPLLANAGLMVGIFHGDRLIVANRLGPVELGLLSVAIMLALVPTQVLGNTLQALTLPRLAAAQAAPARFAAEFRLTIEGALLVSVGYALVLALVGPPLLVLLFGAKYAPTLSLFVWLVLSQGVRLARTAPAIVAIARAETANPMWSNLVRVAVLPLLFVALGMGASLMAVAWLALAGELAALGVAFWLLRRRLGLPLAGLGLPVGGALGLFGLIGLDAALHPPAAGLAAHLHAGHALLLGAGALYALLALPTLGARARRLIAERGG